MIIYKVIRRYTYGSKPHEVQDLEQGLFIDKPLAEDYIKRVLYKAHLVEEDFFEDVWKSAVPEIDRLTYYIVPEVVHER